MREMMEGYDRRAREYDRKVFADDDGQAALVGRTLANLRPGRTLDVARGTGRFTSPLPGDVVGFDQSRVMLPRTRGRRPEAPFVRTDAPRLPFADGSFDPLVTSLSYGLLGAIAVHGSWSRRGGWLASW